MENTDGDGNNSKNNTMPHADDQDEGEFLRHFVFISPFIACIWKVAPLSSNISNLVLHANITFNFTI